MVRIQNNNQNSEIAKYLTFELKDEHYGLEIIKVIEIVGLQEITSIPQTPDFVKGIINLRGDIHPVIDLRQKFNMGVTEKTEETCIIIVTLEKAGEKKNFGLIVDRVSEVMDIAADEIDDSPSIGGAVNTDFILGIAKKESKVIILLNIDAILSSKEMVQISEVAETNKE